MGEATFYRVPLQPSEWMVACPVCESAVPVEAEQRDDGSWAGVECDQFPECAECHSLIEVAPVTVNELTGMAGD